MISVYLAGPSRELPRVKHYAAQLESRDVTIAHKWWEHVEAIGVGNDARMDVEEQRRHAATDAQAALEADILWCLWPNDVSHGTAFELGYILGHSWGRQIVVTGRRAHECIYTALAWRDASDDVGLVEVLRLARELSV